MEENNSGWAGIIILGLIIYGGYSLFSGDEDKESLSSPTSSYRSSNTYSNYDSVDSDDYSYDEEEDSEEEAENPYNDGSGHYAGYEWAEENDVSSCGGNSDSFIEGCQEYLDQQEN